MKYVVIGAGMMGSAAASDLAGTDSHNEVVLADIDFRKASMVAAGIGPNVTPLELDINSHENLVGVLRGSGSAISAVSYSVNYAMTQAAIEAGVHLTDLGGNNDVVKRQLSLHQEAEKRNITIVPNCGLAPGLTNVLAMEGVTEFDSLESVRIRVGGLPQNPRPPLNYQIVFAVEGLINEYIEKAAVIRDGEEMLVESLTGTEELSFPAPFTALEAFHTSGGLSTLTTLLAGKVKNLDYKTIRYKGHCEKFRTLLDLGFASNEPIITGGAVRTAREFFEQLLRKKLGHNDKDVVLGRVTIKGLKGESPKSLEYEFVDYYDEKSKKTAMMRTTAFPTSVIAQMLAEGVIRKRGVLPPEQCVPGKQMIDELRKRNIIIRKTIS